MISGPNFLINNNGLAPVSEVIGGVNPVLEALRARGDAVLRIYVARGRSGSAWDELSTLAKAHGVRVERVERARLDRLYQSRNHQGVVAQVGPYRYFSLEDVLEPAVGPRAMVLVLDGIQDPMNLGALIRSAEAAGASGLILPRERAAPLNQTAVKASAGAAEYLPVARVVNLSQALDKLKKEGFWVLGLDAEAPKGLYDQDLPSRLALVIGGEGRGIRRLVKENCDSLAALPRLGRVNSLNASVAGALAMFEFVRQHRPEG